MWIKNHVFMEDLSYLRETQIIPWKELHGKTIFITGATGLIGYTLASALLYYELAQRTGLTIIALVRNLKRAKELFQEQLDAGCNLKFVEGTVEAPFTVSEPIDYLIHCASPTSSTYFVSHPVETIDAVVGGTKNMLELAKKNKVKGMVFLSSMEAYGQITTRIPLKESDLGYIDLSSPRSSYPEGKRLAENLCCGYVKQYQLPVFIARLAQTFGPGVPLTDTRVFTYMARCARSQEDICLKTNGCKENMYLYTADAVAAILLLLLRGKPGITYNVANEETYCSVKEMADMVARTLGENKIQVFTNCGETQGEYPPEGYLNLDTSRLKNLGWKPTFNLQEMFFRMSSAF